MTSSTEAWLLQWLSAQHMYSSRKSSSAVFARVLWFLGVGTRRRGVNPGVRQLGPVTAGSGRMKPGEVAFFFSLYKKNRWPHGVFLMEEDVALSLCELACMKVVVVVAVLFQRA